MYEGYIKWGDSMTDNKSKKIGTDVGSCSQTNDKRESASDILEHVSVLYKYTVHNEYVVEMGRY
jgi:hypothetical protein